MGKQPFRPEYPSGLTPEFHQTSSLTPDVIRAAYVYEDRAAIKQIEDYGWVTRQILKELISSVPAPEPDF